MVLILSLPFCRVYVVFFCSDLSSVRPGQRDEPGRRIGQLEPRTEVTPPVGGYVPLLLFIFLLLLEVSTLSKCLFRVCVPVV